MSSRDSFPKNLKSSNKPKFTQKLIITMWDVNKNTSSTTPVYKISFCSLNLWCGSICYPMQIICNIRDSVWPFAGWWRSPPSTTTWLTSRCVKLGGSWKESSLSLKARRSTGTDLVRYSAYWRTSNMCTSTCDPCGLVAFIFSGTSSKSVVEKQSY